VAFGESAAGINGRPAARSGWRHRGSRRHSDDLRCRWARRPLRPRRTATRRPPANGLAWFRDERQTSSVSDHDRSPGSAPGGPLRGWEADRPSVGRCLPGLPSTSCPACC